MKDTVLVPIRRQVFCGSKRRGGEPDARCRRPAGWGTDHVGFGACKLHFGSTPMHGVSVRLRQAVQVADLFAVPREDIDPVAGLIEELQRSAGMIEGYEAMCAGLSVDEVVWGEVGSEELRPSIDAATGDDLAPVERKVKSAAGLNTWVRALNDERDRFIKLCEAMIKLDLDARRLTFQQSQVTAIVQLMMSPDLALNEDQRRVAARMLRELDARQSITIAGEVAS